jgi:hypothetical protein
MRSEQCQNKTKFLIQLKVEQTNFAMSKQVNGESPSLTEHDNELQELSSSVIVDNNHIMQLNNTEKTVNTVLEKFFNDIKTNNDGTKSAKCLLCGIIVKQSSTSTYNYGRHVQRKHQKEMDQWKAEVECKKSDNVKKQPTIQQSFGQRSKSLSNNIT